MMKKMIMVLVVMVAMTTAAFAKDYYYCIKNGNFSRSNAEYFESALKFTNNIQVSHKGNINRHELVDGEYSLRYEVTSKNGDKLVFIKLVTNEKDGE